MRSFGLGLVQNNTKIQSESGVLHRGFMLRLLRHSERHRGQIRDDNRRFLQAVSFFPSHRESKSKLRLRTATSATSNTCFLIGFVTLIAGLG